MSLTYDEARAHIKDGDCIAVRETKGLLTPFTRFFSGPETHIGIACWIEEGLWMGELNAGRNHLIPMSQLADTDFDVYYPPVQDRVKIRASVMKMLRVKINYSLAAMVVIGFIDWLRIRVFLHPRQALVCSGWGVAVYEDAGWPEHTRIVSPRGLVSQLGLKFQVRKTK